MGKTGVIQPWYLIHFPIFYVNKKLVFWKRIRMSKTMTKKGRTQIALERQAWYNQITVSLESDNLHLISAVSLTGHGCWTRHLAILNFHFHTSQFPPWRIKMVPSFLCFKNKTVPTPCSLQPLKIRKGRTACAPEDPPHLPSIPHSQL